MVVFLGSFMQNIQVMVPRATSKEDSTPPVSFLARPVRLDRLRIGFLDNTKPNSDKFLSGLADQLKGSYSITSTVYRRKHDSSSPAADNLLQELAHECDVVVNAVPD